MIDRTLDGETLGEVMFYLRDLDHLYTHEQVCVLLEEAERLGFSLERGSELANMTVRQLETLAKVKQ